MNLHQIVPPRRHPDSILMSRQRANELRDLRGQIIDVWWENGRALGLWEYEGETYTIKGRDLAATEVTAERVGREYRQRPQGWYMDIVYGLDDIE